jgi:hypothetical protein
MRNLVLFAFLLTTTFGRTAISQEKNPSKPVGLADLDVTFISRTPRYERLRVSYHQRKDGLVGDVNPYLTSDEKRKKRWPEDGENVTFTAHVKNHGNKPVKSYDYLWFIDGRVVESGISGELRPEEEATFKYEWVWRSGQHTVSFQVDPQEVVPEVGHRNDQLTERTDALTFHFHVEKSTYEYFRTIKNSWGTFSWEDWAQTQVALMNDLFRSAVYPLTPNGIEERVRLDMITIHPDSTLDPEGTHAPEDWEWDGRWGFTVGYLKEKFYEKNPWAIKNEWSLIHELGHQIGRIDLYCLDVTKEQNEVNGEALRSKFTQCLMHRGIYLPQDEVHFFCEHTAYSLNRDKGVRRGHFGEYLYDIPKDNYLQVLSSDGTALGGAGINVYQAEPYGYTEKKIRKTAKLTGTTDRSGLFRLGSDPFGEINNWGTNGVFLVEIVSQGEKDYHWLETPDFNLAYWRGHREKAVFTVIVHAK